MDYKATLNLPKTKFPMKADLPAKEPEIERFWDELDIYAEISKARSSVEKYVLHDGPPYANGPIHIGHALNKTLKDIVVKYKTMRGFNSDFVPGWDCHGLPVEHQLFKELNITKAEISQVEFRKKAYDYAMNFVNIQKAEFKRLGVFGDWSKPYLTLSKEYEVGIVRSFAKLVEDGYIYKGLKPVNYCYRCETALAEAEVEYEDHTSPSIFVKFRVKELTGPPQKIEDIKKRIPPPGSRFKPKDIYFVIWTTTPWTLIANVAVALHPDETYYYYGQANGETWIVAEKLMSNFLKVIGKSEDEFEAIWPAQGKDLEDSTYEHPFKLREGKVVLADYVSMEEGTGCVHTAPGHGQEDYETGLKYGLETVMPVDEKGSFTEEAAQFKGKNVHQANPVIVNSLKEKSLLLHQDDITHSYPHCWRCKNPIIFRATEQWFMSVDNRNLRQRLLDEIKKVEWIPAQGEERISTMVENRPDWCLSRQRYWGVPIPVFLCKICKKWIKDPKLIEHFAEMVKEKGSDAWFSIDVKELLPSGYSCDCGNTDFEKGLDIIDVWFESGVSHQAVLKERKTLSYPADLYLEGSDQHRGWFQSAIITSMAIDEKSAFKSVLTHGFVVDGEGRKMSKSLGNVIAPQEIIKDYGADILRLWVASSDYNDDVRISDKILARLSEAYRKIRNTGRFILGNLYDFNPEKDAVGYESLLEIDKWAISKAHSLLKEITRSYDKFLFHKVYHALYNFCIIDMSNFYLDVLKDRLYTFKPDSLERRSCQTAIYEILKVLVTATAPILVFTAEEMWQNMPRSKDMPESTHLNLWPDMKNLKIDKDLEAKWQEVKNLRDFVLKVLEEKRTSGIIGSSLEAKVIIYTESDKVYSFLKDYAQELPAVFIVSQAELKREKVPAEAIRSEKVPEVLIVVKKADGEKCARCWNYSLTVGKPSTFKLKLLGKDKNYPKNLCQRCQEVLKAL